MKLVVGNFKMNLLKADINNYLNILAKNKLDNVVFCPSYLYLSDFVKCGYEVGSQNIGFDLSGAYTGDLSIAQLKEIGIKYTLIGHSERRSYYNDDKFVNKKLQIALENSIIPILCIGESLDNYQSGNTRNILKDEIDEAFKNIDLAALKNTIMAYEPIWAIGTGIIPTNEEITSIIGFIKEYIKNNYDIELMVLYGGSVNNKNIECLNTINNVDGYLVGGCSINPINFINLINNVKKD